MFDREDYYPHFVAMMQRYDNLYGDTAIMASLIRWTSLARLSREADVLRQRIVHGSDYPFPPARLPYLRHTGLFPPERRNPFDLDLRIKRLIRFRRELRIADRGVVERVGSGRASCESRPVPDAQTRGAESLTD